MKKISRAVPRRVSGFKVYYKPFRAITLASSLPLSLFLSPSPSLSSRFQQDVKNEMLNDRYDLQSLNMRLLIYGTDLAKTNSQSPSHPARSLEHDRIFGVISDNRRNRPLATLSPLETHGFPASIPSSKPLSAMSDDVSEARKSSWDGGGGNRVLRRV